MTEYEKQMLEGYTETHDTNMSLLTRNLIDDFLNHWEATGSFGMELVPDQIHVRPDLRNQAINDNVYICAVTNIARQRLDRFKKVTSIGKSNLARQLVRQYLSDVAGYEFERIPVPSDPPPPGGKPGRKKRAFPSGVKV
jgi:hypothetical protein